MARPIGSKFETHLPYFQEHKIGAYCWGFVSGKTQTIYPWDSWKKKYDAEPKIWFHDIFRKDGKPYDEDELKAIKEVTSKRVEVRLRFSVDKLDPRKPGDAFIESVLRNGTPKPIRVPAKYDGGWDSDMKLTAFQAPEAGLHWIELRMVRWAGAKTHAAKVVQPGEECTMFKDSLNAVLRLDLKQEKPLVPKEEQYYWSWSA
jgi:hypothetical protein